jgi:hypothetical protein
MNHAVNGRSTEKASDRKSPSSVVSNVRTVGVEMVRTNLISPNEGNLDAFPHAHSDDSVVTRGR